MTTMTRPPRPVEAVRCWIPVSDLRPGDCVDFEDDQYADPDGTSDFHAYYNDMFVEVEVVEPETPGCIVVFPTETPAVGFPPDHRVFVDFRYLDHED